MLRRDRQLALIGLAAAMAVTPYASGQGPDAVAVEDEPHHHVVFQNALVRIMDVDIPPAGATVFHRHARDNVAVMLTAVTIGSQLQGKSETVSRLDSGQVSFTPAGKDGYVHRVINRGTTDVRLLDIELIVPARAATPANAPNPSVTIAAENEKVRAYKVSLAPGQSGPPMALGAGVLVVPVGAAIEQSGANGALERLDPDGPRWRWRPAGTYTLRNTSVAPAVAIEIELKRAPR